MKIFMKKLDIGTKFTKLQTDFLSTPGVEIEPIFALRISISEIQAIFQNFHTRASKTWPSGKFPEAVSNRPTLSIPDGPKLRLLLLYG